MNLHSRYALEKALAGTHAFLAPSSPAWINYDEDRLARMVHTAEAARLGSRLHAFAHEAISLRRKQPDTQETINLYINDAIGYRMTSEVLLHYSENCYGHADTVGFRDNTLRIHDLKNGAREASMAQLEIYAALFCLDYQFSPFDIKIELRIYQNNRVKIHHPEPPDIIQIMERIRSFDKYIKELKKMED